MGRKPTPEIKVRVGTLEDLDGMMELAMMATDENAVLPPNPMKLLGDIYPALMQDHGICGIIGEPGERIEGAVLLRVGKLWYTDSDCLEEKAIFIHPDFRDARGGRAKHLCEFSKRAADSLCIPLLIGVLSSTRTAGKIRLYERQFGDPVGAFFLYNAQTGQFPKSTH